MDKKKKLSLKKVVVCNISGIQQVIDGNKKDLKTVTCSIVCSVHDPTCIY
ncbi:MAG: hypothetical protein ACEPOV_03550 [Hyphomicrobiales bacterium]